jgi:hypothetical protein
MIFLLEYDSRHGKLCKFKQFSDTDRVQAQRERLAIELELKKSQEPREVVLLEAADEDTVRRTHKRYFETTGELVESMMQPEPQPE